MRACALVQTQTFVVLPFPERLSRHIVVAMRDMVEAMNRQIAYANAFWSRDTTGGNSLIVFASEYKEGDNIHNKNQLGMDFGAAKSQRRALRLDPAIVWGAACAKGFFLRSGRMMYGSLSYRHIMLLTASQDILYAPHHQWDTVDFMKCHSFLYFATGVRRSGPENSCPICCLLPLARDYSAYYCWTEKT